MKKDQIKTYTIQEAAKEMQVSAHTLRYYEKIGLLHPIPRSGIGHRYYVEEDLGWIYWLKLLRDSGMPIQTMKVYVSLTRSGEATIQERCGILEEHRNILRGKIANLERCPDKITKKVEFYQGYKIKPARRKSGSQKSQA
jgi:DNA-binding transcriptional MerR regulator